MARGMVEVKVTFRKSIYTKDFVSDEDRDDLEEDDDPDDCDITLEEAASRLQELYENSDPAVQDETEFDSADIEVRVIGG